MRDVVWSTRAARELARAVAYRAQEDWAAAERFRRRIVDVADALGGIPTGHPGRRAGTFEKSIPEWRHIMVYALDHPPGTATVLRLIHASRHWPKGDWPD